MTTPGENGSTVAALMDLVRSLDGVSDAKTWDRIFKAAEAWKSPGYDDTQLALRHHYEGKIEAMLRAKVSSRFPNTGHKMPLAPLNWAQLYAENAAAVWDLPPHFYLEDADGVHLDVDEDDEDDEEDPENEENAAAIAGDEGATNDEDDGDDEITPEEHAARAQRARDFATMCDEAELQPTLAEIERRSELCGDCFVRIYSDSLEASARGKPKEPRTRLLLIYPNDAWVIPHPAAPAELACSFAIIVKSASRDGVLSSTTSYECWHRDFESNEPTVEGDVAASTSDASFTFGAWRCTIVEVALEQPRDQRAPTAGGPVAQYKVTSSPVRFPKPGGGGYQDTWPFQEAPFVVFRSGIPTGAPFVDKNRNLPDLFDSANASVMAELFAGDMGAASVLVRKTDEPAAGKVALGAGLMISIRKGDDLISVPQTTDFAGIRGINSALLAMIALTSRQSINGFSVDRQTEAKSGVALAIENEPQTKARIEKVARMIPPTERLLYLMAQQHDSQRATDILGDGTIPRAQPQDPPEYEELQTRQTRFLQLRDAGLITDEKVLVAARVAPDEDTAREIIEAARAQSKSRLPGAIAAIDASLPTGVGAAPIPKAGEKVADPNAAGDVTGKAPPIGQAGAPTHDDVDGSEAPGSSRAPPGMG